MKEKRYDIFLKELGGNLRRIRKEKNLTMEDVAFETDIEYRQLGRIERGEVNTIVISLLRIAEALKTDISLIFNFDKKPTK